MSDMAKISVIVPIYNTERFLERCLTSLQNQTEQNIEFLLIDDASTDRSLEIMDFFQKKDKRFKIITSNKNNGVSIARNKGIELATGEYIGFVDSDDYVDYDYFEVLSSAIEESNVKIAISNSILIDNDPKDVIDFTSPITRIMEGGASSCMRLFERDLIGDDRFIEHCRFEDSAFTFLMHMKSGKMIVANTSEYYYCSDNENSFSKCQSTSLQSIIDSMRVIDYLQTKVKENKAFSLYQERINLLELEFLYDNAECLMFSSLEKSKSIELLTQLDVLIDKKYHDIREYIANYGSIKIAKYSKEAWKEPYLKMSKEECENNFKCKIKTLIQERN